MEHLRPLLEDLRAKKNDPAQFTTEYLDHQIPILRDLWQYNA